MSARPSIMKQLKWLFIVFSIQGLAAVLWTLFTPSESGHAVFLWLSPQRMLLLAVILAFWGGVVAVTIWLWSSEVHAQHLAARLDELCLCTEAAWTAVDPALRSTVDCIRRRPESPAHAPGVCRVSELGAGHISSLALAGCGQSADFHLRRPHHAGMPGRSWRCTIGRQSSSARLGPGARSAAHWCCCSSPSLRSFTGPFSRFNCASWSTSLPGTGRSNPFHFPGATWHSPSAHFRCWRWRIGLWSFATASSSGLILLFLLGWFMQMGVGIMAGGGFASLADRYFSTYHKAYVVEASRNHSTVLDSIQRYEELYGSHPFTSTKPPGLMAFYIGFEQLVNGHPTTYSDEVRYERLSRAIEIAFPVLAASMVFLIYLFARRFLQDSVGSICHSGAAVLCSLSERRPLFPVRGPGHLPRGFLARRVVYGGGSAASIVGLGILRGGSSLPGGVLCLYDAATLPFCRPVPRASLFAAPLGPALDAAASVGHRHRRGHAGGSIFCCS